MLLAAGVALLGGGGRWLRPPVVLFVCCFLVLAAARRLYGARGRPPQARMISATIIIEGRGGWVGGLGWLVA